MAEQEFAQALGKQGGLGLARLVEAGLNRASAAAKPPAD
jgi:Rod binding domain-containing protein